MARVPIPLSCRLPPDRDPLHIPSGWGLQRYTVAELEQLPSLLGSLMIWEYPRPGFLYGIGVDVADGIGQDRAVADILRFPTIDSPAEQVAQYISDRIKPRELAFVVDALGRLYRDRISGLEAIVAIETNNHGLSTQDVLDLHLGYRHFYRREYLDQFDPATRETAKKGWYTDKRTRPIILDYLRDCTTTYDPVTGQPDLKINSPFTLKDFADFHTETILAEAEAAPGQHDDCVMALAIINYVAYRLMGGEQEPLAEARRRKRHESLLITQRQGERLDWRNQPFSLEDMHQQLVTPPDPMDEQAEEFFDERGRIWMEDFRT